MDNYETYYKVRLTVKDSRRDKTGYWIVNYNGNPMQIDSRVVYAHITSINDFNSKFKRDEFELVQFFKDGNNEISYYEFTNNLVEEF